MIRKVLLISILFLAVSTQAQWVKATVTFKNGDSKNGFIKKFDKVDTKTVQFKTHLKDRRVKFKSIDLKSVEFVTKKGKTGKFVFLKEAYFKNKKGDLKIAKKENWFALYYEGDFQLLDYNDGGISVHYLRWPENDYAVRAFVESEVFTSFVMNKKNMFKNAFSLIFKGHCDKMVKAFESESFKPKTIEEVVRYYEKHCSNSSDEAM